MPSSLIERFRAECRIPVVAGADREAFLSDTGVRILYITGDEQTRPETGDLTVVLREILGEFEGRVHVALADRAEEPLFRDAFGIKVFPSMVFFLDGRPMGVVPGMKRWEEYTDLVRKLLGEPLAADFEVNPFFEAMNQTRRFTRF